MELESRVAALEASTKLMETLYTERLGNMRAGMMADIDRMLRDMGDRIAAQVKTDLEDWKTNHLDEAVDAKLKERSARIRRKWIEGLRMWVPVLALLLTILMWVFGQISHVEAVGGLSSF